MADASRPEKMTEDTFKSIVKHQLEQSLGFAGDELSASREKALDYYHGRKFGNEQEGRSQVVSRDVAETVSWFMPSLLRVFLTDDYVTFDPEGEEDVDAAEQETAYVNHVIHQKNEGFLNFLDWFKDALLSKTGIATWWWDKRKVIKFERYTGLTREEYDAILSEDGASAVEETEREQEVPADVREQMMQVQMAMPGQPMQQEIPTHEQVYDCLIKIEKTEEQERWMAVPPEDFVIGRNDRDFDTCKFCGHSVMLTKSDLRSMGIDEDKLDLIVFSKDEDEDSGGTRESEATARDRYNEDAERQTQQMLDESGREVRVYFLTIRVDYDGDGYNELRRVIYCQGELLENDYTDEVRYADICPERTPHRFFGQSIADLVMDLQLIKSTLWRQSLDNMYLANNPQKEVVEGQVNLDDLLTPRVGGLVRTKQPGMVNPIAHQMFLGESLEMMRHADEVRENRTGVSRFSQGLEPDALNKNAGADNIAGLRQTANERVEMVARIFAETGVKRLMRGVHADLLRNQRKSEIVKLRNEYVEVRPTEWRDRMNMTVTVGLGNGNKDIMLAGLDAIGSTMQGAASSGYPIVQADNVYEYGIRQAKLLGFKDAHKFYTDPKTLQAQPPQPSEAEVAAQTAIQIETIREKGREGERQAKAMSAAQEAQASEAQAVRDHELAMKKVDADLQATQIKANNELVIAREKMEKEAQTTLEVARIKEEGENRRASEQANIDRELLKKKADGQGSAPPA